MLTGNNVIFRRSGDGDDFSTSIIKRAIFKFKIYRIYKKLNLSKNNKVHFYSRGHSH